MLWLNDPEKLLLLVEQRHDELRRTMRSSRAFLPSLTSAIRRLAGARAASSRWTRLPAPRRVV